MPTYSKHIHKKKDEWLSEDEIDFHLNKLSTIYPSFVHLGLCVYDMADALLTVKRVINKFFTEYRIGKS